MTEISLLGIYNDGWSSYDFDGIMAKIQTMQGGRTNWIDHEEYNGHSSWCYSFSKVYPVLLQKGLFEDHGVNVPTDTHRIMCHIFDILEMVVTGVETTKEEWEQRFKVYRENNNYHHSGYINGHASPIEDLDLLKSLILENCVDPKLNGIGGAGKFIIHYKGIPIEVDFTCCTPDEDDFEEFKQGDEDEEGEE